MNTKGREPVAFIMFFFFLMVPVALGIVLGNAVFYNNRIDVRQAEADFLADRIEGCLRDFGIENFDVSLCGIFRDNLEDSLVLVRGQGIDYSVGVRDYEVQCDLQLDDGPACSKKNIILDGDEIEIITASNQKSRRQIS